jgi:hypothetical protein
LLITHLILFGAGVGLTAITMRSRRQALDARAAALDTRETFVGARADQLRRGAVLGTSNSAYQGRRRAPEPAPSLLTASLADAVAMNGTASARAEQERRAFADIMTNIGRAKLWCQATASVVAESMTSCPAPTAQRFQPSIWISSSASSLVGAR